VDGTTESVWGYPRSPRVEPSGQQVTVELGGSVVTDTKRAPRVLETSHPPVYCVPLQDVLPGVLKPAARRTSCELEGAPGTARW
jgi:uncharacterized protein (DUF427 family)